MIGYFRFDDNGVSKMGYFHKYDGNQFFSVQLFRLVEKITDRNDPMYVVEKPQLRFAPELILDSFRTYAVDLNHYKVPIYVVHREFLEDESILFRHGMADIFFISNKTVDEDGTIVPVDKVDFPIASIDSLLTGDVVDPTILSCIPTFLDIPRPSLLILFLLPENGSCQKTVPARILRSLFRGRRTQFGVA